MEYDDNVISVDNYYAHSRCEMTKYIPECVEKLLDIGCADGNFGAFLKQKRNIEIWGVELFEKAAQKATSRLDHVLIGSIEDDALEIPLNYFDCVVFNDVLEHLSNPWQVLNSIKKFLKKEGYLVASVPNVRYFQNIKNLILSEDWNYVDEGVLDKTHLRFFTIKSFRRMMEECQYNIIELHGINQMNVSWKYKLLNALLMNKLHDMRNLQIVCVAKINSRTE